MNTEKELQLLAENARLRAQIELLVGGQVERIVREVLAQVVDLRGPDSFASDSEHESGERVAFEGEIEERPFDSELTGRSRAMSFNRQGRPRAPMMPGEVASLVGQFRKVTGGNPGGEDSAGDYSNKRRLPPDLEKAYGETVMNRFQQGILLGAMGGLVLLVISILGVVGWLREDPVRVVRTAEPVAKKTEEPPVTAEKWKGPQPREVADRFLSATYQEERLRWVRKPEAVADLVEAFYQKGAGSTEKVATIDEMPEVGNESGVFARFAVTMENGSRRLLCVPFDEGGGRVDFEAYIRHCSLPWPSALENGVSEEAEMRVFLQENAYYNHDFSDEDQWQSYTATSPELEEPVFVYAKLDDPNLSEFLKESPKGSSRYTIGIKSTGTSHLKRQFILSKVICSGWVKP